MYLVIASSPLRSWDVRVGLRSWLAGVFATNDIVSALHMCMVLLRS